MKLIDANPLEKKNKDAINATLTLMLNILKPTLDVDKFISLRKLVFSTLILIENSQQDFVNQIIETLNFIHDMIMEINSVSIENKEFVQTAMHHAIEQITV